MRALHEHWHPTNRVRDLPGLSRRGRLAIARLEQRSFWPGAAAEALDSLTRFVRDPFHRLWYPDSGCGIPDCCPNVTDLRHVLDAATRVLPPADARQFRRRVAEVDELW